MSILIKNPRLTCRMKRDWKDGSDLLDAFSGGHIYIEGNQIVSAGPEPFTGHADTVIDASRMVVLPGLVNTHHHFFQTLTRNVVAAQNSELFDWLITHYEIWRGISGEAFYVSAKTALAELLKSGCTTSSDHLYLFPRQAEDILIDREIEAARELGIRFQPTRGSMSMSQKDGGLPPDDVTQTEQEILEDTLRLIKTYHDPSPGAMIRVALAPCSPFSVTRDLMQETAKIGREYNLQIHTHLAETKDEENFCMENFGQRPFDYMESLNWIDSHAWFAHSIYLNENEIRRGGKAGIGVAHCPSSNMRLSSGIAHIKEMLKAGINVGIGVDGSASNDSSNMLMELRQAMLLSRLREPEFRLTAGDVLWMGTVGGAKALGREDIGQILPGKCADLIMVSMDRLEYAGAQHDPAAALVFNVTMEPVDYSIVNGKIVVEKGAIKGFDEHSHIVRHQNLSDQLVAKAQNILPDKKLTR